MIASERFQFMSLEERGLLYSMRLYCWVNGSVPSVPDFLAALIGVPKEDVGMALSAYVLAYFEEAPDDPSRLVCPELDMYRAGMKGNSRKRSEAGKLGAAKRWRSSEALPSGGQ